MRLHTESSAHRYRALREHMLEHHFHKQLVVHWVPKIKVMIPSYGGDPKDRCRTRRVRKEMAEMLGLRTA